MAVHGRAQGLPRPGDRRWYVSIGGRHLAISYMLLSTVYLALPVHDYDVDGHHKETYWWPG